MEARSSQHSSVRTKESAASVTPKKPSSHRVPENKRLINSFDNLFCYVLLTALMVANAVAIIVFIVALNSAINNPIRDPDVPLNLKILSTTTQATNERNTTKANLLSEAYSEDIKKWMDLSVSPCDDFYTHACGGWHKMDGVKDSTEEMYMNKPRQVIVQPDLIALLKKPNNENDPIYKNQVKKFYAACNEQEKLEARGSKPFIDLLSSMGKFGLLDSTYSSTDLTLQQIIGQLTAMGIEPLFRVRRVNYENFSGFLIRPPEIPIVSLEKEWMQKNLKNLGANTDDALTIKQIEDAVAFQGMLNTIIKTQTVSIKSKKTVLDLKTLFPDWFSPVDFFNGLAATNPGKMSNITDETEVMVENTGYFTHMSKLFKHHTEGEKTYNADYYYRAADNYVLRTLMDLIPLLGYNSLKELNSSLKYDRSLTCLDLLNNCFRTQIIKMFIDESYDSKPDAYVKDMITDLKTALRQRTTDSAIIKVEDKKLAYDKLDKMQAKVGYVEELYDEKELNNIYKWGPSGELFEAFISALRYEFNNTLWSDNVNWLSEHNSLTESIAHLPDLNYLVVPGLHLLETPFLNLSLPSSMNYGSMGFILSYLITKPWLETQHITQSAYEINPEKEECFVKEYTNFMFDQFKVDGRTSLYENIVDNEAIKTSYKGYENYIKRKGNESQAAEESLSHAKMFFISFAQMLCQAVPSSKAEAVLRRPVAPNRIRVLGSLRNFNTFAEAFKCKTDGPMNPESKCQKF